MADSYDEPEKAWDEYDWERFLQQQDSKTERYMELFEKHIDDPNRDQIIAQEMGWTHLLDQSSEEVEEIEFDSGFEAEREAEIQPNRVAHDFRRETKTIVIGRNAVCFQKAILAECSALLPS